LDDAKKSQSQLFGVKKVKCEHLSQDAKIDVFLKISARKGKKGHFWTAKNVQKTTLFWGPPATPFGGYLGFFMQIYNFKPNIFD
jgi:hypothetical protein